MSNVTDMIKTAKPVVPMIYAYTTPEIHRHDGWTKIGYTEQDVQKRLNQQMHTADIKYKLEWMGNAIYDDGSGKIFHDSDFHAYLQKNGIERTRGTEWFHITGNASRNMFYDFRSSHGLVKGTETISYKLRKEQDEAVSQAAAYRRDHEGGEFLWNAKPRFGKTLSVYDFCKQIGAVNVLVVTNRPAIANSWYADYAKFLGTESGYVFVSNVSGIKDKPLVVSREEYVDRASRTDDSEFMGCIEFVSLQDLKGAKAFGGKYEKLREVANMDWDVLVIDEAHEGVDTYKTDLAFDQIKRKFTLHLSGTPFKALANDKFPEDAIYNWTYADEQKAKQEWDGEGENPYANLPQLNLFTYQMSEIIKDELRQGIEINGETEEYAFDLNEFFETNGHGSFVHDSSVDKFLDALTKGEKYPFSTDKLRNELKHTLWLLNRVDSAKALAKKLEQHPVFSQYKIVLAAGDNKLDEDEGEELKQSFDAVTKAIRENDKTITLSVGQLTTGVTIPEWTAVLMLSNVHSPSLYMQAAFRAQNPCMFYDKETRKYARKENCYVFDFDPARTLVIVEQYANDLSGDTANGNGDMDLRKKHIRTLLNFLPVIGEDDAGEMIELDAEKVLSIPRKIRCQEVVRRGFMSNFLFQNITNIFSAPQEVIDIIISIPPQAEGSPVEPSTEDKERLNINEKGEVEIPDNDISKEAKDLFGGKIYDISEEVSDSVSDTMEEIHDKLDQKAPVDTAIKRLQDAFVKQAIKPLVEEAKAEYGTDMRPSDRKRIEAQLEEKARHTVQKAFDQTEIERGKAEAERDKALQELKDPTDEKAVQTVHEEFIKKQEEITNRLKDVLQESAETFVEDAGQEIVKTVQTGRKEHQKDEIMEGVRAHLRGFARTIPSFLMAYASDHDVTLENFDRIIPPDVFKEVTSITLDQFLFLRDGGLYKDKETGEEKQFEGHLFDPVVFNDSVKEFIRKKKELADYFNETNEEDIFDYIPPQKTNQIFTPKKVVKEMVDLLEKENPGCFDQDDKTFIDLYMKSGLYITEIVKRLYNSDRMKELYQDPVERLQHIFADQVYGLAPTEIIYRIATNYILGFSDEIEIKKHNFRLLDALPYAEDGTLEEKLEELFGRD
ncbi:hypothetical protein CXIVA_07860 [Clostridium sp. SY8519]|uniref:DEAD/DEAH box helicase family protein n=1 Tax=Clostridium sp. (strain SY8519) TaxID=1042156 RepID=UPI000217202E|nr:DEAD/DEAH box helicase family protein [Clostridium sp. SY8519]BAK46753.1 hypothetical protein CXIVA_07860 [Clostridium sp. SY8519]